MIKVTERYYIQKDTHHGWQLLRKHIAKTKETGEEYEKFIPTYHPNLEQIAAKILWEESDVEGDLDDLKNAWFSCVAEIKKIMEENKNA